ncbi:DUF927 domain-containing protein [Brevibacillus centrosporus]|uniref:DUF927 domain-containing protein n=1 Tax=Brevibacillus centrosporus TaxID=54910 RepID=UPI003B025C96
MNFDQLPAQKNRLRRQTVEPTEIDLDLDLTEPEDATTDDVDLDLDVAEPSTEPLKEVIESTGQSVIPTHTDHQPKKNKHGNLSLPASDFRYGQFVGRGTELLVRRKDENGKWKEEWLSDLVFIKAIQENIDEQTFDILLQFWFKNHWREKSVKRSQLQINELTKLLDHGVDVPNYKVGQVAKFLSLQEKDAPLRQVHHKLGWADYNGELVYQHQEILSTKVPYSSTYRGNMLLQKGTYEGWKQVIKQEVLGHTPLEFALTCGFASPLVALIARIIDMEVLIFHAYGDAAQGKTTAGRVFVSPFGLPSKREGGLVLQWYGTKNGLVSQLRDKHGFPIVLDEASMNRIKDFTDVLYLLAEGREKARMTKEIEERKRASWSGFFFSTAEHSLQQKSNQNSGLLVRLQEKGNVPWTRSAENSNKIKEGLLQHYGQAGPMFVQFLIAKGKDAIVDVWKKWAKLCHQKMILKDSLSERMADKFALILATAELMNECFDFSVNIGGILEFLLEMDQENVEGRDLGERAYQYLKQMVIQHQANFIMDGAPASRECWGSITRKSGKGVEVTFMKEPFKKLIHEGGFDDSSVVLGKLKAKGYLDHEANKLTRKRKLDPDKPRLDVHILMFDDSLLEMLKKEPLPSSFVTSKTKSVRNRPLDDRDDYEEAILPDLD